MVTKWTAKVSISQTKTPLQLIAHWIARSILHHPSR